MSFAQASLAATILASTFGTYVALSPPNPNPKTNSASTSDSVRGLYLAHEHSTKICLAPIGLLALQTASLAFLYPSIPTNILRYGPQNGFNANVITWSSTTTIPLALILCAGIPLRLVSYASLGKNFTFALAEPDRLTTTGIYRYVQHPSYLGIAILASCNGMLLCRTDGAMSTWAGPQGFRVLQFMAWLFVPLGFSALGVLIWTRVKEEERMLQAKFGKEWERWHKATARFLPGIF
ncbi:hypothetical protein S7711_06240 [Stachybotrys chartarum IBT 7711]|uniref:Protein-S-isoprenylcysteine O-methyltransferase n=1 Tax=Stachybotrys chartarum (strain CBS 109288 / IBT 7711) TaxID=1280523 RepID=A0A084AWD5_STACB|nr:hypothetical protein S7711_06240 [Stachybotrys chartarum IBT 7711]KFA45351.1 hypothetical protein S40293_09519 [Stachybotrys chartarum IBT 40293]